MTDDFEALRLCREIAELKRQIQVVPLDPAADGYGPMTRIRPLAQQRDHLVRQLATLACSTIEAQRARAYVLYEATSLSGTATDKLAHAVACDLLEPR